MGSLEPERKIDRHAQRAVNASNLRQAQHLCIVLDQFLDDLQRGPEAAL
jgi:hypothetical protein